MNTRSLEEQLIAEALRETNGNISKVSRQLGIDYLALRSRLTAPSFNLPFSRATTPEPQDIGSLGRPGMEQYVVAIKPRGTAWPSKYDMAIADARKKFDAGTHEMAQGHYQGWVIQYCIPRKYPKRPCRFFADMVVMR